MFERADAVLDTIVSRHFVYKDVNQRAGRNDRKCSECVWKRRAPLAPNFILETLFMQLWEKQESDYPEDSEHYSWAESDDIGKGTLMYMVLEEVATKAVHEWLEDPVFDEYDERRFAYFHSKEGKQQRRDENKLTRAGEVVVPTPVFELLSRSIATVAAETSA